MEHHAITRYAYHRWANNRVIDHLEQLPAEIYAQEIKSVFPSISETLAHIYLVDGLWLSAMSGDSFEQTQKVIDQINQELTDKSLEKIKGLFAGLSGRYETFLAQHNDLEQMKSIKHPSYGTLNAAVSDLVEHIVNHGTYHRGNITAMLRQQGHAGVPTDYDFYLYQLGK